jgi:drug/metabolite transporter (DMT)-like permease
MAANFHHSRAFAIVVVLLSAVCYSTKAIFAKLAYRYGIDPIPLITIRMLFSAPFFAAIALIPSALNRHTITPREHLACVLYGFLGLYLSAVFDFEGLRYISAGLERTILFSYPTVVTVLSFLFFGVRATKFQIYALLLTYVGIAIPFASEWSNGGSDVTHGALLVGGCAITYALYMIGSARYVITIGALRYISLALLWSTFMLILHACITCSAADFYQPVEVYTLCAQMAVLSTVLPSLMLGFGIKRLGASTAAILSSVGPVSTIVLASLFLNEPTSISDIIGVVMVVAGVTVIAREKEHQLSASGSS